MDLTEAGRLLIDHKIPVRVEHGPCDARAAIHLHVSPADVDRVYRPDPVMDGESARAAYEAKLVGDVIVDCHVYLRSGSDTEAIVHESLHCVGYGHALNPPTGHVLNARYERIGLDDWRGITP